MSTAELPARKTGRLAIDRDLAEAIGFRIRARRGVLGLRQIDIADRLGVSNAAVSGWEAGSNMPAMGHISGLCRVLNWTPNDLFGWEDA